MAWHRARPAVSAPAVFLALALAAIPAPPALARDETVHEAICRLIEDAARTHDLPVRFFTRLIWRESSFRRTVTSRAGAQGIAQFMPGTAAERGLADPFDPEQAIPASAALLDDLRDRFGNLGLAAAGYNAGPRRVERWQAGEAGLPFETEAYVRFVTGHDADAFLAGDPIRFPPAAPLPTPRPAATAAPETPPADLPAVEMPSPDISVAESPTVEPPGTDTPPPAEAPAVAASAPTQADVASPTDVADATTPPAPAPTVVATLADQPCLTVVASIRTEVPSSEGLYDGPMAPWGVQLAGNYSKTRVLASFARLQSRHARVLADFQPLVIGTRVGGRGPRRFYRVRIPMETRKEANALCRRLRVDGGSCLVQRN